jgi:SAM-dependent methyltransferase
MSGFSAEWLALREAADHRSRNADLARRLAGRLVDTPSVRVMDFGSGTGSNLRATAPLLGANQEWTLVDYDHALLEVAARVLTAWADEARAIGDQLVLVKGEKTIGVSFRVADLNRDLESLLTARPDLVTASALFDLISESWMKRFASALAATEATFYTVLTYDGRDEFNPIHPFDHSVMTAFGMHQRRDKGFGPAAGPQAAASLARALKETGFTVETGDSAWILKPKDNALIQDLLTGIFGAVKETGFIAERGLDDWLFYRQAIADQKGAMVITGHTDILAFRP